MRLYVALVIIALSIYPATAHAYIDPGSGSALMSIIIGAFVAVGLAIKSFWYKITGIFTGKSAQDDTDDSED